MTDLTPERATGPGKDVAQGQHGATSKRQARYARVGARVGLQLPLDRADDPRLAPFVATHAQGQQTPEPGAPCTGGLNVATGGP